MSVQLKELQVLEGHKERVWCCEWCPDGKFLLTSSADRSIRVWVRNRFASPAKVELRDSASSPHCTADAKSAISSSHSHSTSHKDSHSDPSALCEDSCEHWECTQVCTAHSRAVRSVAWNPNCRMFASAGFDSVVIIWEYSQSTGQFEVVELLDGHENEVKSVHWSASGELLASGSRDKSVWLWEMRAVEFDQLPIAGTRYDTEDTRKKAIGTAKLHSAEHHSDTIGASDVATVLRTHDTQKCADFGLDDAIEMDSQNEAEYEFEVVSVLARHSGDVKCVVWVPNAECLLSGSYDDTIKCWAGFGDDYFCSQTLRLKSTVWSISPSEDGNEFVSASGNGSIVFWKRDRENEQIGTSMVCFKATQRMDSLHCGDAYHCQWLTERSLPGATKRTVPFEFVVTSGADSCVRLLTRRRSLHSHSLSKSAVKTTASECLEEKESEDLEKWCVAFECDNAHDDYEINWASCGPRLGALHSGRYLLATGSDDYKVRLFELDVSKLIASHMQTATDRSTVLMTDDSLVTDETVTDDASLASFDSTDLLFRVE